MIKIEEEELDCCEEAGDEDRDRGSGVRNNNSYILLVFQHGILDLCFFFIKRFSSMNIRIRLIECCSFFLI